MQDCVGGGGGGVNVYTYVCVCVDAGDRMKYVMH